MNSFSDSKHVQRTRGILGLLVTAYIVLLPYQFEIGNSLNLALADCALLMVLVLAAGQLKYLREAWTAWHFGIVFTFIVGSFVAALRFGTVNTYELMNKDAGLLLPLLSYAAVTSMIVDWGDVRHILRVFTLGVVIQNVVCVGAYLATYFLGVGSPFARYRGLRLSGMLLDPNAYGGLLAVTIVLIEAASFGPEPLLKKPVVLASRVTLGLGLLFTFSRSAWLAMGVSLLLLVALRPWVAVRWLLTGLICAPCVFLVMGHRFMPIFQEMASRPKQVQGRFDLIHDALAAFARHPLIGGGIGSFRLSEGEIAHNSAMWFLADFGVVGLTVFLGFVGWFFIRGWSAYRLAPVGERPIALALLLAHTAMFGLAMGIEAFYQRHWWLVLGLIASSYSLAVRQFDCTPNKCGGLLAPAPTLGQIQ
jgi:putative inorganic carbon (hco3(-)) transporter